MPKLYHYVHCPYCIRVRMGLGFLNIDYESIVLDYDDESTPLKLTNRKMLPIFEDSDGLAINESLTIIKKVDSENKTKIHTLLGQNDPSEQALEATLGQISKPLHNLLMPYWIYSYEFNHSSKKYFQEKKEVSRGPFKDLFKNRKQFLNDLSPMLIKVEKELRPFYHHDKFSIYDIMLASHLWGLYVYPEFRFSDTLHNYLQNVKEVTSFDYHQDFWR